MKEHIDLVREWRALGPDTGAILATVVSTKGSVYRKTGARMLLVRDQWLAGSISGGCVESDLLETAWSRTENGPALATYDAMSPDDAVLGFGLGCNGVADVLIERLPADGGALAVLERVVRDRVAEELITVISPGDLLGTRWTDREQVHQGLSVLHERLTPPPSLVIFGAGNDAIPLAKFAKGIGWHVAVVDSRAAFATRERFPEADRMVVTPASSVMSAGVLEPGSASVIMTHSYLKDLQILRNLATRHEGYIGILGPHHRSDRLIAEAGCPPARVHAPIGLDLGAAGPEEIALSILAEILAVSKDRAGGHLGESGKSSARLFV